MTVFQVLCWSLLGLAAAFFLRRGWLRLFGPVLFYDMVRQARRLRYFILRLGYAGLLVFFLFIAFLEHRTQIHEEAQPKLYLRIAESYFYRFVIIQFIAVLLLTPAYVGGAIADEKERKTLEFMLATDLHNREIVLSKLLSRLANLTLIVLVGLPILSFLQFLGGIDPNLLLASFAATFLTLFGMGGFSIFVSVYLRKPRDAIVVSYLGPIVYVAVGLVASFANSQWGAIPVGVGKYSFTVGDAVGFYNSGNLLVALGAVSVSMYNGTTELVLAGVLRNYAIFHVLVGSAFTAWAVLRLRSVALQQAHGTTEKTRIAHKIRPEVWDESLLWKEIFVEGRQRRSWIARFFMACLFLLTIGLLALRFVPDIVSGTLEKSEVAWWTTIMGTAVAGLIILAAGVRASTCISGERDKDTFDFLLTTPLSSDSILWAKFLGCLLNLRRSFLWIGIIWAFAVLFGGMSILGVVALFLSLLTYVAFYVMVGLWFSMNARSTMRATVFTILTTAGISCGHWLFTLCCAALFRGGGIEGLVKIQAGMTPLAVLGFFHFLSMTEHMEWGHGAGELVAFCVGGLIAYVLACVIFFSVLSTRFRDITHRNN